jgi:hypothetical protein
MMKFFLRWQKQLRMLPEVASQGGGASFLGAAHQKRHPLFGWMPEPCSQMLNLYLIAA